MSITPNKKPSLPTPEESRMAAESSRKLATITGQGEHAQLCVVDDDQKITVPFAAVSLLRDILMQMGQGNAVAILPIGHSLTTQQAADLLNVSRPYLVGLLEDGKIPFTKVGRHRRVRYADLLDYAQRIDTQSRQAVEALTREAQDLEMGY